jgi:predicted site-specific integrase-resolvase
LCRKEVGRLVVLRQDRLLRFGAEPVFEQGRDGRPVSVRGTGWRVRR